ncbi:hypothetical protein PVK06_035325 [Gossypium arboreum]|uniref:Uncharacterized protein n=1 Tax=Gossypium arboreum TaxID=29729 RepID=A0ABR0NGI5_GOSAR|nr:hypothetical protein PVK06_035325 [Gossypium arboreum]
MDSTIKFLIEGRGVWKCHPGTDIPTSFNQVIMFPEEKIWIQFLYTRVAPTLNQNIIRVLNHTPNMFGPAHPELEEKEHESKEEKGIEEREKDDEVDFDNDD